MTLELSLITPVYNEEENLPLLYAAIQQVMKPIGKTWEVIFVDDGSRDKSLAVLETLVEQDPEHVRVVACEVAFLVVFIQWYINRYLHLGVKLGFPTMIALIVGLWVAIIGLGWWRDRKRV
jgi:glycosyltransferase involved in cell wall biosynthesis